MRYSIKITTLKVLYSFLSILTFSKRYLNRYIENVERDGEVEAVSIWKGGRYSLDITTLNILFSF